MGAANVTLFAKWTSNNSVTYFHILSTGQSLSVGAGSAPVLSTSQPYNNLMLG
jgi:hypothetical protein